MFFDDLAALGALLGISAKSLNAYREAAQKLQASDKAFANYQAIKHEYMREVPSGIMEQLERLKAISQEVGTNEFTLAGVFLLDLSATLRERYRDKGIPDEIFINTMSDLSCKDRECVAVKGVPGCFVGHWYEGFFNMTRFGLGRFEYEERPFPKDITLKNGISLKKDSRCLNFHIPSSKVPLTDDIRLDSYKKAYNFFSDCRNDDGSMTFICGSWLLYPENPEILPQDSNILRFFDDFEIIDKEVQQDFADGWRVFGADWGKPFEELPENTSLQKAIKTHLLGGGKIGLGHGAFLFDGERIIK